MNVYLRNRWVPMALALFALGSVPLATVARLVVVAPWLAPARVVLEGVWLFTFWSAVFCLAVGIVQVRGERQRHCSPRVASRPMARSAARHTGT